MRCIKPAANASIACMMLLLCLAALEGRADFCFFGTPQWSSVACSADGTRLVAGTFFGSIFTSLDRGLTWAPQSSPTAVFLASSADGTRLVVAGNGQDNLYTSTDGGFTWTPRESRRRWASVASSADGTRLVALDRAGEDGRGGFIYTSTDGGATWTQRESKRVWSAVASSANGLRLIAAESGLGNLGGLLYTSTDGGVTWLSRGAGARAWSSLASSEDGNHLVAAALGGQLYTSTNGGVDWTARETNRSWTSVASSTDGMRLVAADGGRGLNGGQLYTSTNGGVTWTARESSRSWKSVASSADGTLLIAAAGAFLYTTTDGGVTWINVCQQAECDLSWTNPTGGAFSTADNWSPAQAVGNCANLGFSLALSYAATFGNLSVNSLSLSDGSVQLDGGSLVFTSSDASRPSLSVDDAGSDSPSKLLLETGSYTAKQVVVGSSNDSDTFDAVLDLGDQGITLTADTLVIGSNFNSEGTVRSSSTANCATGGACFSNIVIHNGVEVGREGVGQLLLTNTHLNFESSSAPASFLEVASFPGAVGRVVLTDLSFASFRNEVRIGVFGNAFVSLLSSSSLSGKRLILADNAISTVTVRVDNDAGVLSSILFAEDEAVVGVRGSALITLVHGGQFNVGRSDLGETGKDLTLGEEADGGGTLLMEQGPSEVEGPRLDVSGTLTVGSFGQGILRATSPSPAPDPARALNITADALFVGSASARESLLELNGGQAEFGDFISIGFAGGQGRIALHEGALVGAKNLTMADSLGSSASLLLKGNTQPVALLIDENALIGGDGRARVDLVNDAELDVANCEIGTGTPSPGALTEVVLTAPSLIAVPELQVGGILTVGVDSNGLLAILGPGVGSVTCGDFFLVGGGPSTNAGGTINLAPLSLLRSKNGGNIGAIRGGGVGPALVRVAGGASILVDSTTGSLDVGDTGLVLLERGSLIDAKDFALAGPGGRMRVVNQLTIPGAKQLTNKQSNGPARITGKLDLAKSGTLDIEATGEAMLLVEGGAELGGTLNVLLTPGATYTAGQNLQPLQIKGEVTGAFEEIRIPNASPGFAATPTLENGIVTVTVTQPGTGTAYPPTGSPLDTGVEGDGEGEGEQEGQLGPGCNGCQNGNKTLPLSQQLGDWILGLMSIGIMLAARYRL